MGKTGREKEYCVTSGQVLLAVRWRQTEKGQRIVRILLSEAGRRKRKCCSSAPTAVRRFGKMLASCLEGSPVGADTSLLACEHLPPLTRRALELLREVPRGKVTTYGNLAVRLGIPGAARAVGNAMAANPFPIVFPCHRVVRADRCPGGFGSGSRIKRLLLEAEGVEFSADGRVAENCVV